MVTCRYALLWSTSWRTALFPLHSRSRIEDRSHDTQPVESCDPRAPADSSESCRDWILSRVSSIWPLSRSLMTLGSSTPSRSTPSPHHHGRHAESWTSTYTRHSTLSREIAMEGCSHNLRKAELLPRNRGTGSHLVLREMTSFAEDPNQRRVVLEVRHLGRPYSHHKHHAHQERQWRISAVKTSTPVASGRWRAWSTRGGAPPRLRAEAVLCTP